MSLNSEADLPAEGPHVSGSESVRCRQHWTLGPFRSRFLFHSQSSNRGDVNSHLTNTFVLNVVHQEMNETC